MQDRPTARELIEAAAEFLNGEVAPTLGDARLRFRVLVAANVLNVVARELKRGDQFTRAEWERLSGLMGGEIRGEDLPQEIMAMTQELCKKIRAGEVDEGAFHDALFEHVEQTVIEKLEIANPRYLAKSGAERGGD